jgi:hypothetical protein
LFEYQNILFERLGASILLPLKVRWYVGCVLV